MSKTVLITGGNRGIGLALVSKFLAEGFHVVATSRNGKIEGIQQQNLTVFQLDVTSTSSIADFILNVKNKFTSIEILINNAGVGLDLMMKSQIRTLSKQLLKQMFLA